MQDSASQPGFLFHDYETFGTSPSLDRPSQFAAIRTDADLNEIDAALVRDGNDDGAGLLLSPSISIARALIEHWHAGMRTRRVDAPTHAETGH